MGVPPKFGDVLAGSTKLAAWRRNVFFLFVSSNNSPIASRFVIVVSLSRVHVSGRVGGVRSRTAWSFEVHTFALRCPFRRLPVVGSTRCRPDQPHAVGEQALVAPKEARRVVDSPSFLFFFLLFFCLKFSYLIR